MSKIITSPVKRWAGTIEITDNPTWDQIDALEASFEAPRKEGDWIWLSVIDRNQIPAILAWVEKWDLQNFPDPVTEDSFPRVPTQDRHKLVEWIYKEMKDVYFGDIPNE